MPSKTKFSRSTVKNHSPSKTMPQAKAREVRGKKVRSKLTVGAMQGMTSTAPVRQEAKESAKSQSQHKEQKQQQRTDNHGSAVSVESRLEIYDTSAAEPESDAQEHEEQDLEQEHGEIEEQEPKKTFRNGNLLPRQQRVYLRTAKPEKGAERKEMKKMYKASHREKTMMSGWICGAEIGEY